MPRSRGAGVETGIELVYGEPGSGKSYYAVKLLIETIIEHRRPVYTNLPMRWRVVRKYLRNRGGEELANLIQPITEDGFMRFINRYTTRLAVMERLKADHYAETGQLLSKRQQEAAFLREHGADVYIGRELNWVPHGAMLILDEVHHWFPNPSLASTPKHKKQEPEALLAYLTMHRHVSHKVVAITQKDRQISQTFKTLGRICWRIHPRAHDRIVYGLTFGHLTGFLRTITGGHFGAEALGYEQFTAEEWERRDQGGRPNQSFSVYHTMPWNSWVFRLYDSFTHAGSKAYLRQQQQAVREAAGLLADGRTTAEAEPQEADDMARMGFIGWTMQTVILGVVVLIAVGALTGSMMGRLTELEERTQASEISTATEAAAVGPTVELTSMTPQRLRFSDGTTCTLPGTIHGMYFDRVVEGSDFVLGIDRGNHVWMWRVGR